SAAPYQPTVTVPAGGTTPTLGATAGDALGKVAVAGDVMVLVIPDPLTTAVGRAIDGIGMPIAGATVMCLGGTGMTGGGGTFALTGLPNVRGYIQCEVSFVLPGGTNVRGHAALTPPVRGGTTTVGDIVLPFGGPGPLFPGSKFVAGDHPVAMAVADLNEDGTSDIVVINDTSRDISVLLGHGDGAFATQ